jgi:hypothetical protein
MSRKMISAQQAIFGTLDDFCAAAGEPVTNAGTPRWIRGTQADSEFLAGAYLADLFRVTPRRMIARLDFRGRTFFCTLGFQGDTPPAGLNPEEATPGLISVLLAEASPRPKATPFQVKNAVELADKTQDGAYNGHDHTEIADLFGPILVFEGEPIEASETWRAYYEICLGEIPGIDTWIEESTAKAMAALTDLSALGLPYQILCRSLFDTDPAGLFLALYRCLEALYAYTASTKVATAFGFSGSWQEVAVVLEREIGWRPREEESLAGLFSRSGVETLKEIFDCLGEACPNAGVIAAAAAKRTYKLRNSLVHYRPIHHTIEHEDINWNELCITLSLVIREVYFDIFTSVASEKEDAG